MDSWIYLVITLFYAGLGVWGIMMCIRGEARLGYVALFAVTAALIWDNGVMAAGTTIGEGGLLESLNTARYWLHAFCTPLLVLASLDLIRWAGSTWAKTTIAKAIAWIFTAGLIVLELTTHTFSLQLKPMLEYGALRYVPANEESGPPVMVLLIMIPLLAAGITLWKRKVTAILFLGTALMLVGSMISLPVESSAITNVFELILIASLWYSVYALQKQERRNG
ncbi:hypothetical protein C2I18_24910 [Paenibacillus sp. PK3_47]|uniref:hypothetical protein n=1 Tax=Paenibacillus sp. PK3_47 TaxID=2072642 RepID=UPI00201D9329|nr:hypothetical protein [Paenibacillus sp. PK3_47]UQZ36488.1 hypothetical protein C2I18_24910 [Paenibacillus sp. PK3_47]